MKRLALAIIFVLGLVPSAWADFQAGVAAYNRGDYATAFREMKPLADQGNASAQFNRGLLYSNGQGVPQNYGEAMKWYRRAAEQGHAPAQFNLGLLYSNGQGVPQNYGEAVKWYRKAAEQGYAKAQTNLGVMYDNGQGVPQDYAEAVKWYRRAAEQGYAKAQTNLGVMYDRGQGMPQDYVQAHKWFNLAASYFFPSGESHDRAVKNRDIVAAKMTAAQIAEAQRLAREWKPKTQTAKTVSKSLPEPPATSSETVKSIQTSLAALGFKPGPADGILGPRTRSAIEAFQRDQGVLVTGEASANLRTLLLLESVDRENAGKKPKKVELSD